MEKNLFDAFVSAKVAWYRKLELHYPKFIEWAKEIKSNCLDGSEFSIFEDQRFGLTFELYHSDYNWCISVLVRDLEMDEKRVEYTNYEDE